MTEAACERVVDPALASSLSNGLNHDAVTWTANEATRTAGWTLPMSSRTGTTNAEKSDAFCGFTNTLARADAFFDDSGTPRDTCTTPLRHCTDGNLTVDNEPGRSWFGALSPVVAGLGAVAAPALAPQFTTGNSTLGQP